MFRWGSAEVEELVGFGRVMLRQPGFEVDDVVSGVGVGVAEERWTRSPGRRNGLSSADAVAAKPVKRGAGRRRGFGRRAAWRFVRRG